MERVMDSEVIDEVTSSNIDMLAGPADAHITDFNLNLKRDIILRKFCSDSSRILIEKLTSFFCL